MEILARVLLEKVIVLETLYKQAVGLYGLEIELLFGVETVYLRICAYYLYAGAADEKEHEQKYGSRKQPPYVDLDAPEELAGPLLSLILFPAHTYAFVRTVTVTVSSCIYGSV